MKPTTLVPVTCALLLGWAPGASAASLSIDADDAHAPMGIEVAYSGAADAPSDLSIYAAKAETTCAASSVEQPQRARAQSVAVGQYIPAGPFEGTLELSTGGTHELEPGTYHVCAYLTPESSTTYTPSATAADSVTYGAKKLAVRTYTRNCFTGSPRLDLTSFGIYHGSEGARWEGQRFAATLKVLVSAATKREHGLPSTVLMQGKYTGSSGQWTVRAPAAVARKLKKIRRVRATFLIRYTAPFTETATRPVFFINNTSGKQSKDCGLVYISSSGDWWPPALAGGPGVIGGGSDDGNSDD